MYAQQKAVEPLYERKSDITLIRELGNRLAPEMWPWKTDEEMFDFLLGFGGLTWAELKDKWVVKANPWHPKKYEQMGFLTPTGKAEIYSTVFLTNGRRDPLFSWELPAEAPENFPDSVVREFPFILSTGRRYVNFYHSAYRGIPVLRELAKEPHILINPHAADNLGLQEGDWVWLETPSGSRPVRFRTHITSGIHPRVIIAPHGWWQGCPELGLPDYKNHETNVNCLITDKYHDPDLGAPGMRSTICKVYKM